MRRVSMITLTLLLGCTSKGNDDDHAGDSSSESGGNPDGGADGCAASFCGCWDTTTLDYAATVIDSQTMAPLSGVELYCFGEDMPIATSDDAGMIGFSIETNQSPGCGYERCNNLRFHATTGMYPDVELSAFESNGTMVALTPG